MLDKILNKYHVNNLTELRSTLFGKLKKEDVPDSYVQDINSKKELNPRQFEFKKILEENRMADLLPYEWYDSETEVYQTSRAYGFVFDCGTIIGCSNDLDDQLSGLFSIGIPDGSCMQVLLFASPDLHDQFSNYVSSHKHPLLKKIAEERCKFYEQGLYSSLIPGYKLPVRNFRLIISFTFEGVFQDSNRAAAVSLRNSISSTLGNSFITNRTMSPDSFISFLRSILEISTKRSESIKYDRNRPIREQIVDIDNNVYIASDGMVINDIGVKSIAVREYPREFKVTQCRNLIGDAFSLSAQISYPFIVTQNITFLDQAKENTKLNAAALKTAEQVKPGKFTAMFRIFHKKHAEYQLLQQSIANGEGLMLMNHMVHVFYPLGHSENALQEVKSLYKNFGWDMVTNTNLQLPSLFCSLPLFHDFQSAKEQKRNHMMSLYTKTNVVNMMPLFADSRGTGIQSPRLQLLSPSGQLQYFDIFESNTNSNVSVSASSGSGKSFWTNEMVKSYRAIGAKVSIIDVGRSYKESCDIFGGQYIEFTNKANICVNPFSFIKFKIGLDENTPDEEIDKLQDLDLRNVSRERLLGMKDLDDQITMLKSIFLVSAGIGEDHPDTQLADSYFEQAIISSLQKYQTKSTYTTVYDELLDTSLEQNDPFAKKLADSIKSYTKHGIFGRFFEGESNLDMNNEYIVLELEELENKGNLKFIVLMILMLKITQDMYLGSRSQRKLCIIDEAWALMDGGNTGKFIVTGYRRARKYKGAFVTITQSIDDYAMNPTTLACYNNSGIKIMLQQETPTKIEVSPYVKNTIGKIKTILGSYSEMIIDMNKTQTLCRFIVDDFTSIVYSSAPEDITLRNKFKEYYGLDTTNSLIQLFELRKCYMSKMNRPRNMVSSELLNYADSIGFDEIKRQLGMESIHEVH
jgi:conjugal transfer ATP-binding protein TraC